MKVKRNTLLLLACLVWSAAGFNILRIGLTAYPAYLSVLNFFAVCAGFCRVSAVYLWKTGEKAHQPDCLLFRGATLFPEIL